LWGQTKHYIDRHYVLQSELSVWRQKVQTAQWAFLCSLIVCNHSKSHWSEQVGSLQSELGEWQQEVSSAESEIGRLMSLQRKVPRPAFQRTYSTNSHSSTPRNRGALANHTFLTNH